jgi:DNA adenine methylase
MASISLTELDRSPCMGRAGLPVKAKTFPAVVNVAQVRQLSPFRYPGGKTWLVPEVKRWLRGLGWRPGLFVEPFAGGGIASLTAAIENLADKAIMVELDDEVAAVWQVTLEDSDWFCDAILNFEVTKTNVAQILEREPASPRERAFRTLLRNRMQRGGIMAPGASLVKNGENNNGLRSRWYPETLVRRIKTIAEHAQRIQFVHGDGFRIIERHLKASRAAFFVDPPYTAGGKCAGRRLYLHNEVDHERLFVLMSRTRGQFLMTYDDTEEVTELAGRHGFAIKRVPMKNTHHAVKHELLITRDR